MNNGSVGLSRREKWLIGLLVLFLATVGFVVLLFLPARQTHADVSALLDEARMLETQTRNQIDAVSELEASVAGLRIELAEATAKLNGYTLMEDLVAEFTDFMLLKGIRPDAVTVSFDDKENDETVQYGMIKFTVNLKGTGSIDDLLELADYADGIFSYRLMKMSTSGSGEGQTASCVVEAVLRVEESER